MKKETLISKINSMKDSGASTEVDYDATMIAFEKKWGIEKGLVICMEEMAELQQQISKMVRGKPDILALHEEIVDVELSLRYLKYVLGKREQYSEEDLNCISKIKADRVLHEEWTIT